MGCSGLTEGNKGGEKLNFSEHLSCAGSGPCTRNSQAEDSKCTGWNPRGRVVRAGQSQSVVQESPSDPKILPRHFSPLLACLSSANGIHVASPERPLIQPLPSLSSQPEPPPTWHSFFNPPFCQTDQSMPACFFYPGEHIFFTTPPSHASYLFFFLSQPLILYLRK